METTDRQIEAVSLKICCADDGTFGIGAYDDQARFRLGLGQFTLEQLRQLTESAFDALADRGEYVKEADDEWYSYENQKQLLAPLIIFEKPTEIRFAWPGGHKQVFPDVVEVLLKTNGVYSMKDVSGEIHVSEFGHDVMTEGWIYVVMGQTLDMDPAGLRRKIFNLMKPGDLNRASWTIEMKFADLVQRIKDEDICNDCRADREQANDAVEESTADSDAA